MNPLRDMAVGESSVSAANRRIEQMFERWDARERAKADARRAIRATQPNTPREPSRAKRSFRKTDRTTTSVGFKWRSHTRGASIACRQEDFEGVGMDLRKTPYLAEKRGNGVFIYVSRIPRCGVRWRQDFRGGLCVLAINTKGAEDWLPSTPAAVKRVRGGWMLEAVNNS